MIKYTLPFVASLALTACEEPVSGGSGAATVAGFGNEIVVLNVSGRPRGVLSQSQTAKLWAAYQTASECFDHPTYGEGKGYRLRVQNAAAFSQSSWHSPFRPISPHVGGAHVSGAPPSPLTAVNLDERYGESNAAVERSLRWFSSATKAIRRGADARSKEIIRNALTDWAQSNALNQGIHVSWGDKPVDWQVLALISAIATTTAAMAEEFSPEDRAIIGPWLNGLVAEVAASQWLTRQDNKAYMTSYIALVWALMVGDQSAAQHSVEVFKLAIHDMRPDGSFPVDSQRSAMGLKYGTDSLGYLVMMAALVRANTGQDIFSYDAGGRSLHNAVDFIVKGIRNPSEVNRIYAISCPDGGDRWGSITNPSRHFIETASFLAVYAAMNPSSPNANFIRSRYGNGTSRTSEVFGAPPGALFR